jgi:hypothetical protein
VRARPAHKGVLCGNSGLSVRLQRVKNLAEARRAAAGRAGGWHTGGTPTSGSSSSGGRRSGGGARERRV